MFYLSILFLLAFSACEKEVEIDVSPVPAKLVIISNFNDGRSFSLADTLMRVTVTSTASALSVADTLTYISDAVVELYLEDQFLERLDYYTPTTAEKEQGLKPYYTTEAFEPKPGDLYRLEVSAPNFTPVTATGYIPEIVSESTVVGFTIQETATISRFLEANYSLDLIINNNNLLPNYYHVNLYQAIDLLRINPLTEDTSRTEVVIGPLEFDLREHNKEVLPYINNRGILIKDEELNGILGAFSFEGTFRYNPREQELKRFIIEIRNVSPDYYLYHSSLVRQVRVQSGFDAISGPVVLYNNIENGCGIFAGYATDIIAFDLTN